LSDNRLDRKLKKRPSRFILFVLLSLTCFATVCAVSACGSSPIQLYGLEEAVRDGIISDYTPQEHFEEETPVDLRIITPTMQQLTIGSSIATPILFPLEDELYFTKRDGNVTVFVEENQLVKKGDVLAQLTFDVDPRHVINYEAAVSYLERLEQEIAREKSRRQTEINRARRRSSGGAGSQQALNIRLMEIDLERYTINSDINLREKQNELDTLRELLGIEEIIAPFDGMITSVFDGNSISSRSSRVGSSDPTQIIGMIDPNIFFFRAAMHVARERPYSIIAHGDILTIRGFIEVPSGDRNDAEPDFEFKARVVTDHWADGAWNFINFWLAPIDTEELLNTLQSITDDDPVIALQEIHFSLQVEYIVSPFGMTLPNEAIKRDRDRDARDYVFIYNDGNVEKQFIEAGQRLGSYTHIIFGIDEDTKVVVNP